MHRTVKSRAYRFLFGAVSLIVCLLHWDVCASDAALVPRPLHLWMNGKPRMVVSDCLAGASVRLRKASCASVQTAFDVSGPLPDLPSPLSEYLLSLYYVEGDGTATCRNSATMAYTTAGSRVVFVCGQRFANRFANQTVGGEMILIHEMLHSLGLRENPPSSSYITSIVLQRCR